MKNAVTQQTDPQVPGGCEETDAAAAGEGTSATATEDEVAQPPQPSTSTTSLTGDVPFGIPKSNYALHRPPVCKFGQSYMVSRSMVPVNIPGSKIYLPFSLLFSTAKPKCKVKLPAYNPTPKSILVSCSIVKSVKHACENRDSSV